MSEKHVFYTKADDAEHALQMVADRNICDDEEEAVAMCTLFVGKPYRVTIEELPLETELPRWWEKLGAHPWNTCPGADEVVVYPVTSGWYTKVYGTTADRDAKRDALLAAAKAAGKGGEGWHSTEHFTQP